MALKDLIDHSPRRRRMLRALAAGTAAAALAPISSFASGPDTRDLPNGTPRDRAAAASSPGLRNAQAQGVPPASQAPQPARPPARLRKNGLVYRRLGRTGLFVSEIVLGGSPFPDWSLFRELAERGINYFDTSESYENGNSDRLIGRLFRELGRDKVHVHSRFHLNPHSTPASIIASADASLKRLGTDHVDILGIHGVERPEDLTDPRVLEAFDRLKAQGKFRFRGATCHVNQHAVVPRAVESGLYDMIQFGYNIFDIQETEKDVRTYGDYLGESGARKLIDLAYGRDVGVIAMKVLKVGGRRQDLAGFRTPSGSIQQAMLKWALENERLSAVVTEIINRTEMEEDLAVTGRPLVREERAALYALASAKARRTCRFCGVCRDACPASLRIPDVMRALLYAEGHGKLERARAEFASAMAFTAASPAVLRASVLTGAGLVGIPVPGGSTGATSWVGKPGRAGSIATACASCGSPAACERACPYGRPIREDLRRAAALLG